MKQVIIRARKEHSCALGSCDAPILKGTAYVQNMYRNDRGWFYRSWHGECFIRRLREQLRKKESPPNRVVKEKNGRTSFYFTDEDPEKVKRRRTLLQYLNRDRWKLEGYYQRQDQDEINRSYIKIASRLLELSELGLDFRLNKLFDLIKEHDEPVARGLAQNDKWDERARFLETAAKSR